MTDIHDVKEIRPEQLDYRIMQTHSPTYEYHRILLDNYAFPLMELRKILIMCSQS